MFQVKCVVPVVVIAAMAGGCYQGIDGSDLTDEIAEMRDLHENGLNFNGLNFNGLNFNGLNFNGLNFNGLNFNGLNFNGLVMNGLNFNGLNFNGLVMNGLVFNGLNFNGLVMNGSSIGGSAMFKGKEIYREGEDLIGAEFSITAHGVDADDQPASVELVMRINDVYNDEEYDDIHYYDLSLALKGSDEWTALCTDMDGNPLPVIPLQNSWNETTGARNDDPDVITFACTSGVLAHCTQWGYRPWEESTQCEEGKGKKGKKKKHCETVSLREYHQACTRMARADYCGDGTPWTVPGTPIDIFDHLSPQLESSETKWPIEAEWTADGAYCLDDIRQQSWKADGLYPKCPKPLAKKKGDCGSLDDHRALLVSRFEPVKKKHGKK